MVEGGQSLGSNSSGRNFRSRDRDQDFAAKIRIRARLGRVRIGTAAPGA